MASVQLQFHSDPDELLESLLSAWLGGLNVFYGCRRIDRSIQSDVASIESLVLLVGTSSISDIFVRLQPFETNENDTDLDFMRRNPGLLAASVPHVRDGILRESMLSSISEDEKTINVWRGVVRRAKRDLLRGAVRVAVNGHRDYAPSHWYSNGAAKLSRSGVRMLAIAGTVEYDLESGA